ncbi:MFS transporter [Streptomyces sp. NPDC086549]|uniref:MFS transporter n=1 Tax=Streptomyces sp. NPDC086549 TaxID=3365752 RepID=UPI0038159D1C
MVVDVNSWNDSRLAGGEALHERFGSFGRRFRAPLMPEEEGEEIQYPGGFNELSSRGILSRHGERESPTAAVLDLGGSTGNRDFRLFWLAGAIDGLGTCASSLFVPLILLGAGYPATQVGLVATVGMVTGLSIAPFAGVLADRWPRKRMMYWSALMASGAMGSAFAVVALGHVVLVHLLAVAMVEQVASATYAAAAHGTVRRIVPPERYPVAMSRLQARDEAVQIIGPTVAGLMCQLARWLPLLADALSFLLVAMVSKAIRTELSPERAEHQPASLLVDFAEGVRFIRQEPFLRFVMVWTAGINAVLSTLYFHAVFTSHARGAGPSSIGVILTLAGVGGLLGALIAPLAVQRISPGRIVAGASWTMVPTAVALAYATQTWTYGLLLSLVSFTAPAVVITLQTKAVLITPDHFQGRTGTALATTGQAVATLAPATAGLLVSAVGGRQVALSCAVALAALACYATMRAGLLRLAQDDGEAEPRTGTQGRTS